jgi:hypothetical protein
LQIGTTQIDVLPVPGGLTSVVLRAPDSALGDLALALGPAPSGVTRGMLIAIEDRVRGIAITAGNAVGRAIVENPNVCARCSRILMRAAMGNAADIAKVQDPGPVDNGRMRLAWAMLSSGARQAQLAMGGLNQEIQRGSVQASPTRWPTTQEVTQVEMTGAASIAMDYAEASGAPVPLGQWTEFKACACAAPGSGGQPTTMVGAVPKSGCGCGCGTCT